MVTMTIRATGNLTCEAVHGPSGAVLRTDAPKDVGGAAASFSPTDLVGVALLSCIMTTMGLAANKKDLDLTGMTGRVDKIMGTGSPRKIERLIIVLTMPLAASHPAAESLARIAKNCPVHHALHPGIAQEVRLDWVGQA